ncbi:SHD1 domain-containing protein, partial [Rhodopirellula sallentina]
MAEMRLQRKQIALAFGVAASHFAVFFTVGICEADEIDAARKWATADGRFSVVASLTGSTKPGSKSISLRREDTGVTIQVPVAVLSQSDQEYLRARFARSSDGDSKAEHPQNELQSVRASLSPQLETTKQLGDALIAGLSRRSASLFKKCFATAED